MKLLISACLLGLRCRYDGASRPLDCIGRLNEAFTLIPICPEVLGGLPTPRPPAEINGSSVLTRAGADVTAAYHLGAEITLRIAEGSGASLALLKEKSPSCGCGCIHDGSFSGACVAGDGVCAALLKEKGICVYGESRVEELLKSAEAGRP